MVILILKAYAAFMMLRTFGLAMSFDWHNLESDQPGSLLDMRKLDRYFPVLLTAGRSPLHSAHITILLPYREKSEPSSRMNKTRAI